MAMSVRTYTMRMITPAFIGDAEQKSRWRTPPIKSELRFWWRLHELARGGDPETLLRGESLLFGHANRRFGAPQRSRVRLRLSKWSEGTVWLDQIAPSKEREVTLGRLRMDSLKYLGYGKTLGTSGSAPGLPAIAGSDWADLSIAWPTEAPGADLIPIALASMSAFGAIGGRSRNGFGSFLLDGVGDPEPPLVDWVSAIKQPWPSGIGRDARGPLIWQTPVCKSPSALFNRLATLRKEINALSGAERLLFSAPVQKKSLKGLDKNDRIPASLRLRARRAPDGLRGLVLHVPVRPADTIWNRIGRPQTRFTEQYRNAHALFDSDKSGLERVERFEQWGQ